MNGRIKIALVAVVAVMAMLSCKKEIDWNAFPDPNGNKNGCQLTSLKMDIGVLGKYEISFTYDASGKLARSTNGNLSNTYTYTPNKIVSKDQDGETAEIVLSNGKAISSGTEGYVTVNGISYSMKKEYTYNAEGYLVGVKTYLDGKINSTDVLTYTNGNLSSSTSELAIDGSIQKNTYQYSGELAYNTYEIADPLLYHVDYFPGGYYGKQSKNVLLNTVSTIRDKDGEIIGELKINYTYKFDAKGNASSINMEQISNLYSAGSIVNTDTSQSKFDLIYSCK
ncbi:hypothetical protein [Pedobacter aquatilis]|uniref:hypothetical protein n=1 Tax=Pedobacter aquatilis TaxID=351343 RepID=UPI002931E555|nr:hypothetical protein [Pedobacter aquatilis]